MVVNVRPNNNYHISSLTNYTKNGAKNNNLTNICKCLCRKIRIIRQEDGHFCSICPGIFFTNFNGLSLETCNNTTKEQLFIFANNRNWQPSFMLCNFEFAKSKQKTGDELAKLFLSIYNFERKGQQDSQK